MSEFQLSVRNCERRISIQIPPAAASAASQPWHDERQSVDEERETLQSNNFVNIINERPSIKRNGAPSRARWNFGVTWRNKRRYSRDLHENISLSQIRSDFRYTVATNLVTLRHISSHKITFWKLSWHRHQLLSYTLLTVYSIIKPQDTALWWISRRGQRVNEF